MLRKFMVALVAFLLVAPGAKAQQAEGAVVAPVIVQSLDDPRDPDYAISTLTATLLGAAVGVVAINTATGGAALAPLVGVPVSNLLGGAWMSAVGFLPVAGEPVIHVISVAVVGLGGGLVGNYFARD